MKAIFSITALAALLLVVFDSPGLAQDGAFQADTKISSPAGWEELDGQSSSTARLQVIHNAADPAAATVDIYVNNTLFIDDFNFRTATPFVDVPIAALSGEGQTESLFCSLYGTTSLFDDETLAGLYSDHETYVTAVKASVDSAVQEGFLLQPDGELIKAAAQSSP